jgi:K+-transporting ATPase ATPase C chain
MWNNLRMFLWMTLLTGVLYPMLVTGIAQFTMKEKADGQWISHKGKVVGSLLIGQTFEGEKYFWGRPSAIKYNPLPSGGSNLGPTSSALKKIVDERREKIAKSHAAQEIPSELLFASGSGLDPHIRRRTAYFQMERVAKARGIEVHKIQELIDRIAERPSFGFLGARHVNVLLLNKALDEL